jgi:hypothetical protein
MIGLSAYNLLFLQGCLLKTEQNNDNSKRLLIVTPAKLKYFLLHMDIFSYLFNKSVFRLGYVLLHGVCVGFGKHK